MYGYVYYNFLFLDHSIRFRILHFSWVSQGLPSRDSPPTTPTRFNFFFLNQTKKKRKDLNWTKQVKQGEAPSSCSKDNSIFVINPSSSFLVVLIHPSCLFWNLVDTYNLDLHPLPLSSLPFIRTSLVAFFKPLPFFVFCFFFGFRCHFFFSAYDLVDSKYVCIYTSSIRLLEDERINVCMYEC